mmetsp:Transcript_10006/g.18023  ORF Transcript_10006/g.18023 Transcript_10006/m.18023 type:complete len:81 (-) Transcript_10006:663-905(-)
MIVSASNVTKLLNFTMVLCFVAQSAHPSFIQTAMAYRGFQTPSLWTIVDIWIQSTIPLCVHFVGIAKCALVQMGTGPFLS